ncbi:uncharacterized protein MKK02DRAFT_44504 [Dioszegia hungarica]|uniref:Uncharacterized protein n=1 Tax=Dioszegia hungarica TaxID=4972 RepID=A0AA38H8G9_9TREE|nr:uncharacterized protein MKK02DRAFT_44504 [Dioszegia hungarica]KAI9635808.1 hypothetical protein MKK02DRAFT_44504 [Dioszegia hungarica]
MSSPLASPRSSTSSTEMHTSEPPLTPMSEVGLEKATESLILRDHDMDEEVVSIPSPAGGRGKEAVIKPITQGRQAYRTRPDSRETAHDQFAGFSFGGPPSLEQPIGQNHAYADEIAPSPVMGSHGPSPLAALPIPSSRGPRRSPSPPLPSASFSFGSCPSMPLASTPTAELGAFEYPDNEYGQPHPDRPLPSALQSTGMRASDSTSSTSSFSSTSSSFSRGSASSIRGSVPLGLALGESHRRNSIISRPTLHTAPSSSYTRYSSSSTSGYPSMPQTRRSSTTSTITTIPSAGRRPSIIHSSTTELGSTVPLPSIPSAYPGAPDEPSSFTSTTAPSTPYNVNKRRDSILFTPKHLHQPIPPSLLARRGSMPVAALEGNVPGSSPRRAFNSRSSISIPVAGYGAAGQITSHRLYHRRESVLSVGSSQGSGSTVRAPGEEVSRRSSLRETGRRAGSREVGRRESAATETAEAKGSAEEEQERRGSGGLARRASMPIHHALSSTTRVQAQQAYRFGAGGSGPLSASDALSSSPSSASRSTLPPSSYNSPSRRSKALQSGAPTSDLGVPGSRRESHSGPEAEHTRRWTPRPSLSGRTLSSSEESDESGEGASDGLVDGREKNAQSGEGVLFSDPFLGSRQTSAKGEGDGADTEEQADLGRRDSLAHRGRPTLETVDSDQTERG